MKYKVGSLFAGVGGICLGFKESGNSKKSYKLTWANEIDKYASQTYRKNFNHTLLEGDIRKILNPKMNIPRKKDEKTGINYRNHLKYLLDNPVDILTAGFPCQSFSIAGKQKGFKDNRGNLFYSITTLLDLYQNKYGEKEMPKVIFLENVKNLISHNKGETFKIIKEELNKRGYHLKYKVLNTYKYSNIPQNRERIYIVGFKNKQNYMNFNFFDKLNTYKKEYNEEKRKNYIQNLLDSNISFESHKKYYYTHKKYPHYFISKEEYEEKDPNKRKKKRINLKESINQKNEFYQLRRGMYVRKNQTGVCPTLTANMGTGGHNVPLIKVDDGIRKLTPSETFKFQGFEIPEKFELPKKYEHNNRSFADGRLYKQSGNSVSVPIVKMIATKILKSIE